MATPNVTSLLDDAQRMREQYPEAFERNDTLICYWLTEEATATDNDEVDDVWFGRGCPETQVYINNCPEMNEKDLNVSSMAWGGMLWTGNPTVMTTRPTIEMATTRA